jgi:hypothetical protein
MVLMTNGVERRLRRRINTPGRRKKRRFFGDGKGDGIPHHPRSNH